MNTETLNDQMTHTLQEHALQEHCRTLQEALREEDPVAIRRQLFILGLISPTCREVSWYYYSRNGCLGPRERSPGEMASTVRKLAHGTETGRAGSWCGKWPRTRSSWLAEHKGQMLYDSYAEQVAELPLSELMSRVATLTTGWRF